MSCLRKSGKMKNCYFLKSLKMKNCCFLKNQKMKTSFLVKKKRIDFLVANEQDRKAKLE